MTSQAEIINDPNFIPVLDQGFVGLIDTMGNDSAIVQAARVSYGLGTKSVLEDRGLLRYLMRHRHTSPFEMCQVKLFIKMPIFVMRQWVRHRTASLNEYSGRYSVMTDEFYMPEPEAIQSQSKDNKQGRAGRVSDQSATGVRWMMQAAYDQTYDIYQALLGETDKSKFIGGEVPYDPYSERDPLFGDDFEGIAREMARSVLPVGNYTELYWSQNLHNMMHLLKLRLDPHAQYEIRAFADAVYKLIQPIYPEALQAFDDYVREATTNSRMETALLKMLLSDKKVAFGRAVLAAGGDKAFADSQGMSLRELRDFATQWELPLGKAIQPVLDLAAPEAQPPACPDCGYRPGERSAERSPPKTPSSPSTAPEVPSKDKDYSDAYRYGTQAYLNNAPGGPEFAPDGSKMGWVGNEWLPIGPPPARVWTPPKRK